MARTNTAARPAPQSLTFEGTHAKRLTDVEALRRAVASCLLWEDQFYEDGEAIADRIKRLTLAVPAVEAAKIARLARTEWKLRHAPLWIARWLASGTAAQKAEVAPLLADVIQRPDELTEFLSLYWKDGKTPIAACVKRGLALAFPKFNAYSLAKYNRDDAVKLRDVLFLARPKSKDAEQAATWKQLVDGTLPTPDTWEVALSGGADKKATFTRLMAEGKLGALALLRNLRTMQEVGVAESDIRAALAVAPVDRVLPFRFVAAAKYAPRLEDALEAAMFRCVETLPKMAGKTALVVDTSPSMWQDKISTKSEMNRFDAAAALAILCRELCESVSVYAFNEKAYDIPSRRGFALRDALAKTQGQASCGGLAVDRANLHGYDRIIVLTDGEWHVADPRMHGGFAVSGQAHAVIPKPLTDKAYLINVASYKNAVGTKRWTLLDGWSEAVLDYIRASEMGLG